MASQWILLLLVGYAIATPFRILQPMNDEEARKLRRRQLLDDPDTNTVDRIVALNEETDVESKLYEGDIALTADDKSIVDMSTDGDVDGPLNGVSKRSSTHRNVNYLWTGNSRKIPYVIDPSLADKASVILQAIQQFHDNSCVKWVERTNEPYYVLFTKMTGCWSYIGRTNDARNYQEISIGAGCEYVGIVMHEMLHCMGFWHEQSRPDRNMQVEIMWENIQTGKESNFNKYDPGTVNSYLTPYDMNSIMQYGNYAFSKNGKMTIRDVSNPSTTFGQRNELSTNDKIAIINLYSCSVLDGSWSIWTSFTPCTPAPDCKKTRSRFCTHSDKAHCNPSIPEGIEHETVVCPESECNAPVHGQWGRWSAWGACSKTCDEGTFTRTRQCDDPVPRNGGNSCAGDNSMTGSCKVKSCGGGPGDCEFDDDANGFCDWVQMTDDNKPTYVDFMRGSSTPSSGTGPQAGDHTTGNGKFIYAEASDCLNNAGKVVRLMSPSFGPTGASGRCFTPFYNANGATVGTLNVYCKNEKTLVSHKIFEFSGNQGLDWKTAKIHFTETSANYRIILEVVCGVDYRGDVAFDDFKFTDGACPA